MNQEISFRINFRVFQGDQPFLGKGRIQLLELIQEYGSISKAAQSMEMSYRKAWGLVQEMNQLAQTPLVEKQSGGKSGGGAVVTKAGKSIIHKYRSLSEQLNTYLEKLNREITWN